jgi:rhodanese-related sulfurtransferase
VAISAPFVCFFSIMEADARALPRLQFLTVMVKIGNEMRDQISDIEIEPREVQDMLTRGDEVLLVDVREPWEHETARIEGSVLIPLREIPANLSRLGTTSPVVLYCRHGVRSLDAAFWLRGQGVGIARSMAGGIERWAAEVDPEVPRY